MDTETLKRAIELDETIQKLELEIVVLEKDRESFLRRDIKEIEVSYKYDSGTELWPTKSFTFRPETKSYFIEMFTLMIKEIQRIQDELKKEFVGL